MEVDVGSEVVEEEGIVLFNLRSAKPPKKIKEGNRLYFHSFFQSGDLTMLI